jgi:hypothetical protein
MVAGTEFSNAEYLEYLRTTVFPDGANAPGPSVRSGDFGEILIADYVEFVLGYWCPHELDRMSTSAQSRVAFVGDSDQRADGAHRS